MERENYGVEREASEAQPVLNLAQPEEFFPGGGLKDTVNEEYPTIGDGDAVAYLLESAVESECITNYQRQFLTQKYEALQLALDETRSNQFKLYKMAKQFTRQLETFKARSAESDEIVESKQTESQKLWRTALENENQALLHELRYDESVYHIRGLEDDKKGLQFELVQQRARQEIKAKMRLVEQLIEEERAEIEKVKSDHLSLQQLLQKTNADAGDEESRLYGAKSRLRQLNRELFELRSKSLRLNMALTNLQKEIDVDRKILDDVSTRLELVKSDLSTLESDQTRLDREIDRNSQVKREIELKSEQAMDEIQIVVGKIEQQKSLNASLREDRTEMDASLVQLTKEKREIIANDKRVRLDRDQAVARLRKLQSVIISCKDKVKFTEILVKEKKSGLDEIKRNDNRKVLDNERKKLDLEIDALSGSLKQELNKLTHTNRCISVEEERCSQLKANVIRLRAEVMTLTRSAGVNKIDAELKARDYRLVKHRLEQLTDELNRKQIELVRSEKELRARLHQLIHSSESYSTLRESRANQAQLLATTKLECQKLADQLDKGKSQFNALQARLTQKAKVIERIEFKVKQARAECVTLRIDSSKQVEEINRLDVKRKELTQDTKLLDKHLTQLQLAFDPIRQLLTRLIDTRNDLTARLLERNDEFCVLQEKLQVLAKGNESSSVEIRHCENQLASLECEKRDLQRSIRLFQTLAVVENKSSFEKHLTDLQIQLGITRDRVEELDRSLVQPDPGVNRFNELQGRDPDRVRMVRKLSQLELRRCKKNGKAAEQDMLATSVEQLIEQTEHQVSSNKDKALLEAKQVNERRTRTNQAVRKERAFQGHLAMLVNIQGYLKRQIEKRKLEIARCKSDFEKWRKRRVETNSIRTKSNSNVAGSIQRSPSNTTSLCEPTNNSMQVGSRIAIPIASLNLQFHHHR